jgi:hypothetical protein
LGRQREERMNLKPFICIGEDRENRRRKQKKKSRGRGRSRARLKGEDGGSVSKEGLDSVSKQCMDRTLFLSSVFSGCAVFFSTEKAFSSPTMNLSLLIVTGGFSQARMRKL